MRVTDNGIEDLGTVTQPRTGRSEAWLRPGIRRSLVIGDELWTVSDDRPAGHDLSTLDQVGWVPN